MPEAGASLIFHSLIFPILCLHNPGILSATESLFDNNNLKISILPLQINKYGFCSIRE